MSEKSRRRHTDGTPDKVKTVFLAAVTQEDIASGKRGHGGKGFSLTNTDRALKAYDDVICQLPGPAYESLR